MRNTFATILFALLTAGALAQGDFIEKYSTIETIAGTGEITDKGVNGWKKSFERKDPTRVELSRPHFAMADQEGNIYIADKDAHAVRVIKKKDGKIYTYAGTNEAGENGNGPADKHQLSEPNGLYVMPDGTLFILDLGNSRIQKVDTKGEMTTVCKDKDGISFGRGLWVSANQDTIIWASGTRLRMWTEKSKKVVTYADGFKELGNICMDAKNNLIVTDRERGKVYRFNRETKKVDHIAGNGEDKDSGKSPTEEEIDGVRAVWPTPDGGLLLGCHQGDDLYYLSPGYSKLTKIVDGKQDAHSGDGEPITSKGKKVSEIRSVTVDYEGNIIICENDGGYIRMIKRK